MKLSDLEALAEKATKGDWLWDGDQLWHLGSGYRDDDVDPHRYTGINYDRRLEKSPTLKANAELIVYLANHRHEIINLVKAAKKHAHEDKCNNLYEGCELLKALAAFEDKK